MRTGSRASTTVAKWVRATRLGARSILLGGACLSFCASLSASLQPSEVVGTPCSAPAHTLQLPGVGLQESSSEAEEHYARALRLQSTGDEAGAENEFKVAVTERPQEGRYVHDLALLYIKKNQYERAIEAIREYVKLCGATALGYELEAELLFQRKQFEPAQIAVQRSLELSDNNARMHELLGLIYATKRQDGAGVLELQKASELDPDQPQIRYYCARLLYSTGRYEEARDQFLACLRVQPGFPRALENLGLCYEALRDDAKATEAYLEAIALAKNSIGPKDVEAFAYYGALLARLGQSDKALPVLREAVALSPKSFRANFELGRVLLAAGHLEEAENSLLTSAHLAPNFSRTYYLLGTLRQKQNRPAEADRYRGVFKELDKSVENREFPLTDR